MSAGLSLGRQGVLPASYGPLANTDIQFRMCQVDTCFPSAPDRNLVEIGIGKNWVEAGLDQSIVSFE